MPQLEIYHLTNVEKCDHDGEICAVTDLVAAWQTFEILECRQRCYRRVKRRLQHTNELKGFLNNFPRMESLQLHKMNNKHGARLTFEIFEQLHEMERLNKLIVPKQTDHRQLTVGFSADRHFPVTDSLERMMFLIIRPLHQLQRSVDRPIAAFLAVWLSSMTSQSLH